MTSSNGNIFRVTGHLCREFTGYRSIPITKANVTEFSLIFAWINGWVNNREAGDLRRHRAHYDVIVITVRHKQQFHTVLSSDFQCNSTDKSLISCHNYQNVFVDKNIYILEHRTAVMNHTFKLAVSIQKLSCCLKRSATRKPFNVRNQNRSFIFDLFNASVCYGQCHFHYPYVNP